MRQLGSRHNGAVFYQEVAAVVNSGFRLIFRGWQPLVVAALESASNITLALPFGNGVAFVIRLLAAR
jgi:hypothetical protein